MAYFVVKYLDIFLQIECDIQKLDIQIPARPTSQSPANLVALREAYTKQKIDIYEVDTVAKMCEASKGWGAKTVTFNNYILDRRGPHDWGDSKNPTQDQPHIALLSFIEPILVKKYRKDLLEKSSAARYLRGSTQNSFVNTSTRTASSRPHPKLNLSTSMISSWSYLILATLMHIPTC
jgi:hypothetical protein